MSDETGLKPIELAYAAGYLDGEGSFRFNNGSANVRIGNTYLDTLEWFQEKFGGSVRQKKRVKSHWRQAYVWGLNGSKACKMITQVYPYLQEKRPQAILLLEVYAYPPRSEMRKTLIERIAALKHLESKWTH